MYPVDVRSSDFDVHHAASTGRKTVPTPSEDTANSQELIYLWMLLVMGVEGFLDASRAHMLFVGCEGNNSLVFKEEMKMQLDQIAAVHFQSQWRILRIQNWYM